MHAIYNDLLRLLDIINADQLPADITPANVRYIRELITKAMGE